MKAFGAFIGLLILSLCSGCVIINISEGKGGNPQISTFLGQTASEQLTYVNLVSNGEFETPVAPYPFTTLIGKQLTGWNIDSGSIDLIGSSDLMHGGWQPHTGAQSIDLSGNSPAMISQTISTIPGHKYDLTFWMAGNPEKQEVKTLAVYWDGNELFPTYTFDTTGHSINSMGWKLVTISNLKATKSSTKIAILDIQPSDDPYGVALDDISVLPAQT
jgi:choice-of-anchor C domain-containing protein